MAITNAMAPPPATSLISSPDFHCRNPIQAQPAPIAAHMSMYLIESNVPAVYLNPKSNGARADFLRPSA